MTGLTRKACRFDKPAIDALRIAAYETATEFTILRPEKLLWSPDDKQCAVAAVFTSEDLAIATMQGRVVITNSELESVLEARVPQADIDYPCLVLSSAATMPGNHYSGLNTLLRYYFFSAAACSNVRSIAGQVFRGAPRLNLMADLGYEFYSSAEEWYDELLAVTDLNFALFRSARLGAAIATLKNLTRENRKLFPWAGTVLDF